jgi:CBS domain-containing protein
MKARELMTEDPRTCETDHDLTCTLRIMKEEDVGIVPVTEGNGEGRVVGVVTDRDIALYLGSEDAKPSDVEVEQVMTRDVVSVEPDADVDEVARRMEDGQIRRILVVEGERLLGVISTADLARASSGSTTDEVGEKVERVMEKVSEPSRPRV